MTDKIACPRCGSANWRCWDERSEWFEDKDGALFELPVGYLACNDCQKAYIHYDEIDGVTHVGDHRDAFGYD
jgi:phage terminase large subunit GpA-like protein